jgi:gliding motility-associated-like protein
MLVNASYQPADFFLATVTGLCPNTTYEFSAWIMNVLISASGIQPNLTFHIETPGGIVLGTFNTGNISVSPQPKWEQYGFYFTTTAGNPDVVLRITNNAPGGNGNDLALDDITFRPCGPVLNSFIQANGSNSIDICVDEQEQYDFNAALSPGFLLPVFQWQLSIDSAKTWKDIAGVNSLQYQRRPTTAGLYLYRLTVAESGNIGIAGCRIASNILSIKVHPKPFVNAGSDRVVVVGDHTLLMGDASGENISYSWSPPDYLSSDTSLLPVCTPDKDIYYMLTAISAFGCRNEDYVYVKTAADIFVPTAFTPNNDGKNDTWRIPYLDPFLEAEVKVYNRFGQLVYHVSGAPVNWDGTVNGMPQPSGVYIYFIRFKEGRKIRKGTFTLIR